MIVEDVQDVAPVFTLAPPVTRLPSGLIPGDKVSDLNLIEHFLQRFMHSIQILQVHAEDGDKGVPREIRYGLVSEGNPFTSFFDINDTTGKKCENAEAKVINIASLNLHVLTCRLLLITTA